MANCWRTRVFFSFEYDSKMYFRVVREAKRGEIRAARDLGDYFNGRYVCKTRDLASYLLPVAAFWGCRLGKEKRNSPIKIHIDHKLRGNIVVGLELDSSLGCRGDSGVVYRLPVPYDKLTNRTRTLVLFLFTTDTQPCFKRTAGKTWTGPNHDESLLYVIPP